MPFFARFQANPVDSTDGVPADQTSDDDEPAMSMPGGHELLQSETNQATPGGGLRSKANQATPGRGLMAFSFRSPLTFPGLGGASSGKRTTRTDPVTPTLPKVRIVPRDDKPVHHMLETQAEKIGALEEQIRGGNEMAQHMKDYHEEMVEGLRTQYANMMEGLQAQQATLQGRLMESEQRALETNENAKRIQTEADERAARAEERAKQHVELLQAQQAKIMEDVQVQQATLQERLTESERKAFETNENAKRIQTEADERAARAEERAKKYVELLQAQQAMLQERLEESERRAFEANENVKRIQTEADERAANGEARVKHHVELLQTPRSGSGSGIGSGSAVEMTEQGFAHAGSNAMDRESVIGSSGVETSEQGFVQGESNAMDSESGIGSSVEANERGFTQAQGNAMDSAPPRQYDDPQDGNLRMGVGHVEVSRDSRQWTSVPPPIRFHPPKGGAGPRLQINSRRTVESSSHVPDISQSRTRQATLGILQSDLRRNSPIQTRPHTPSVSGSRRSSSMTPMSPLDGLHHLISVSDTRSPVTNPSSHGSRSTTSMSQNSGSSRLRQSTPNATTGTRPRVTPPSASAPLQARSSIATPGISEISRVHQAASSATTPTRPHATPSSVSVSSRAISHGSRSATPMSAISETSRVRQSTSSVTIPTRPLVTPSSTSASSRAHSSRSATPMSGISETSRVQQSVSSVTTPTHPRVGSIERDAFIQSNDRDDEDGGATPARLARQSASSATTPARPRFRSIEVPSDDHDDEVEEGTHARLAMVENTLDHLIQEFCRMQQSNSSRRKGTGGKFKPASGSCRVRDAGRVDLLRIVRTAMNNVMGMKHDKDIVAAELASAEEVEEYEFEEDDAPVQPTLDPMRPFLPRPESSWNKQLWILLVAEFFQIDEFDANTIGKMGAMFHDRLKRLHRLHKLSVPQDGENYEDFVEHREQKARNTRRRQRAHTRRGTLFDTRKTVTERNRSDADGYIDEAWDTLDFVVGALSRAGMSSDESETDASGQKEYVVKIMPWRSRDVTHLLRIVDDDRNTSNGFGDARPGNAPRKRTVQRPRSVAARQAPSGLPLNFYDPVWYQGLSKSDKRALNVQDTVELPTIDQVRG